MSKPEHPPGIYAEPDTMPNGRLFYRVMLGRYDRLGTFEALPDGTFLPSGCRKASPTAADAMRRVAANRMGQLRGEADRIEAALKYLA